VVAQFTTITRIRASSVGRQNGNAYEEELSDGWNPIRAYWKESSQANRDALRAFLAPDMTVWQYGVSDTAAVSPERLFSRQFLSGARGC
jgi:hypothetical protein